MKEEICRLKNKITEQENLLQNAISRLRATNQVKEGMEQFIVSQRTWNRHRIMRHTIQIPKWELHTARGLYRSDI